MRKGFFITLEGGEGAGKTTVMRMMESALAAEGYDVVATREPGGVAIAEQIRAVILAPENTGMDGRTEALLYAAARRQHLAEKVIPALNEGKIVLCDRFIDSSLAYQGYARGLGIEEVLAVNRFAIGDAMPDLTLFLDVEPEVGLARIRADEKRERNRLDLERLSFHRKVREGYILAAEMFPDRIVRIDAGRPLEDVLRDVRRALAARLTDVGKQLPPDL